MCWDYFGDDAIDSKVTAMTKPQDFDSSWDEQFNEIYSKAISSFSSELNPMKLSNITVKPADGGEVTFVDPVLYGINSLVMKDQVIYKTKQKNIVLYVNIEGKKGVEVKSSGYYNFPSSGENGQFSASATTEETVGYAARIHYNMRNGNTSVDCDFPLSTSFRNLKFITDDSKKSTHKKLYDVSFEEFENEVVNEMNQTVEKILNNMDLSSLKPIFQKYLNSVEKNAAPAFFKKFIEKARKACVNKATAKRVLNKLMRTARKFKKSDKQ